MPWALAAAAVSAAAAYKQQSDNNKNTQRQYAARNAVQLQAQQAQEQNANKGQDILNTTVAKFQPGQVGADQSSAIANRTNAIQTNVATPAAITDPTSNANAPQVVKDDLASKMAAATAFGQQQTAALGSIGGKTDATIGDTLGLMSSGQQLNNLTSFAQGDAGVYKAQGDAAYNNARKPASPWVGAIGALGSALAMHGASNGAMGTELNELPSSTGIDPGSTFVPQKLPAGVSGPIQPSYWS